MHAEGVGFIAPASKTYVPVATFAGLDVAAARPVDYTAARDQGKPAAQRGSYRVVTDTMTLAGPRASDPNWTCGGCWCTPRPARKPRPPTVHASSNAPATTSPG